LANTPNEQTLDTDLSPADTASAIIEDEIAQDVIAKVKGPAPYVVELQPLTRIKPNQPTTFRMSLIDHKGGYAQHKDLRVVDGKRVHPIIVDPRHGREHTTLPTP